jgi:hypothetical protein
MIKNDNFIKYIRRWLISHYSKFSYKPYFIRDLKNRGCYILKFQSISNIEIYVKPDGTFDMWVKIKFENKKYFDNLLDSTTVIKKDKKGFYCDLCIKRVYFKTKAKIWEKHLKDLVLWVNTNFKAENQLVLNLYKKGYEIMILPKDSNNLKENSRCLITFKEPILEKL